MARRVHRAIKGISPVLATLILIVIAVVAGLIVYGWVAGWIGAQKARTVSFTVRVIRTNATTYTVEVKNTGSVTVSISKIEITDPDETVTIDLSASPVTLEPGKSYVNKGTANDAEDPGTEVTVTITTNMGTYAYKVTVE